ncbi:MAG: hypothetical protein RQ899_08385 [Pseudomonadales bacterium]|nr:hypothetical protein [Pseudomonadales bacterium]
MTQDILSEIVLPEPRQLDISELTRGINNYHIDVKLSNRFCADLKVLIRELLEMEASGKARQSNRDQIFTPLRESYFDMMTVLIHRIKTDLSPLEINFLQFAVIKHVLQAVGTALDERINGIKIRASELRQHGSAEVLKVHQHLAWLSTNYNLIFSRVNEHLFYQFQQVELGKLKTLRQKYLQSLSLDFSEFLLNPMLFNRDLNAPLFLIKNYVYWGGRVDENQFSEMNGRIEELLSGFLPELKILPLKTQAGEPPYPTEIYDELDGFHALRSYMGPVINSKNVVEEEFCWFDYPDNIQYLFNQDILNEKSVAIRQEHGWKAWWQYRKKIKKIDSILKKAASLLIKEDLLVPYIASYQTRELWGGKIEGMAPWLLCEYLGHQLSHKKLQDVAMGGRPLSQDENKILRQSRRMVVAESKTRRLEAVARILFDLSRFRFDLKHYRFAHRIFNRMQILTKAEEVQLSSQAGTLYRLPCSNEIEESEARVVHHCILKADVRGSTMVTEKLEKMGLNPASHFSLHFFNPINAVIPQYGGHKVFIEGDAVILGFLEYEQSPQQWFAVARACGLARSMLGIIHANNKHSREKGLPTLELGIGICYSTDTPRYLFDGDKRIMISSAIGQADRLSSCSWKLRNTMQHGLFNVDVLEIAEDGQDYGEKGQNYLHYNVNGILLDNEAFNKLQNEVSLTRVSLMINDKPMSFYTGEYPDAEGNIRELVIREGRVGLWQHDTVREAKEASSFYYEMVTSSKIITMVRETQAARYAPL